MINKVQEVREYNGMSLRELARKTESATGTISNIENGRSVPSVVLALKIARTLHTTVEKLFGGEELGDERRT